MILTGVLNTYIMFVYNNHIVLYVQMNIVFMCAKTYIQEKMCVFCPCLIKVA